MADVFYAARHRFEQNRRDAAGLNVRPAVQDAPGGNEAGVAVMVLGRPILVLPPDDAYRLAKDLADQLTELRKTP